MSFLFRPNRSTLAEAMEEVVELADIQALIQHLISLYGFTSDIENIHAETVSAHKYIYDIRINWNTHIVLLKIWQVDKYIKVPLGFTNGPIE